MILTDMTTNALALATQVLHGKVDKGGQPLIGHAIAVAEQQSDELGTAVALLHDVLEDTPLTRHSLVFHGFPDEVVEAVVALTRRADEDYSVYLARMRDNALARRVKLADLRHNSDLSRLPSVSPLDRARLEKYRQAMEFLSQDDTHLKSDSGQA